MMRVSLCKVLVAILAVTSFGANAEHRQGEYPIQTVGAGEQVVTKANLMATFELMIRDRADSFGEMFLNSDNSVTLKDPFFILEGEKLKFYGRQKYYAPGSMEFVMETERWHWEGVCKFFGFERFNTVKLDEANSIAFGVKMSSLGTVSEVEKNANRSHPFYGMKSITCSYGAGEHH
jgi:hypothetical protein